MEIEFDVEDLIGELDLIEKVQIPFAANQALKQFGFKLSKQVLPNEFLESFDAPDGYGKPIPRTLSAVGYKANGMELTISINKDQGKGLSPAQYLRSALVGGEPTNTVLHSIIQSITKRYPVPAHANLRRLGAYTQYGDIKGSYAAKVISGIEGNFVRKQQPARDERFVATGNTKKGGLEPNRIYRVKGKSFITIFNLFDQKKNLKPTIEYLPFVKKTAEDLLPSILSKSLERAMASR